MKKLPLLATVLLCLQIVFAQKNEASTFATFINGAQLKKHLTIIASPEMEGRETGTEGQRRAAAYIESQFKLIGLQPAAALNGYQQMYPLYKDSMSSSTVKIDNRELIFGTDYFIPVLYNNTRKISASNIVFAGYGISENQYDDYKNIDVKGKVVLIFLGEPKANGKYFLSGTDQPSNYTYPGIDTKMMLAASKGAIAVIAINPAAASISNKLADQNSKTNVYFPRIEKDKGIGCITLSHEIANQCFSKWKFDSLVLHAKNGAIFKTGNFAEIKSNYSFDYKKERIQINASNVLGFIEGTDKKNEYIFITGHYDHLGIKKGKIYFGADDDGSGTCAVINMAEAFAKAKAAGKGPRRTIVFMTVSGEEKGLWGSEYYCDHPVFPLENTSVDLNIDMVGRTDTERKTDDTLNYVYVIGHNKISSDLQGINEAANAKSANLVLDYKFDDPNDPNRIFYRSDHYNFAKKGVPILFFYDGMLLADYHKPTDTVDKINFDLYEKRVRMIFYTAWEIANRNDMLKRDIPLIDIDE